MQIDIHNLSFAYGYKQVIQDMSFTLESGSYLVVRGKNGSGKSTFIKCLLGINPVKSGMIYLDHQDINTYKKWTNFGYVSQKFEDFNYEFPITVNELLSFSSLKLTNQNHRLKLLDQMGILDLINQNINNLSGGQLQRVFIVKAMLNQPKVLILDEPTASIDRLNTEFFYQTVNTLNQQGITIILITHNDSYDQLDYSHVLTMNQDLTYTFETKNEYKLSEVKY